MTQLTFPKNKVLQFLVEKEFPLVYQKIDKLWAFALDNTIIIVDNVDGIADMFFYSVNRGSMQCFKSHSEEDFLRFISAVCKKYLQDKLPENGKEN